jgi:hypothetical protein
VTEGHPASVYVALYIASKLLGLPKSNSLKV